MNKTQIKMNLVAASCIFASFAVTAVSWAEKSTVSRQEIRETTHESTDTIYGIIGELRPDVPLGPTDADVATWGKWLNDSSLFAREEAADKLARSENPKAVPFLLKALSDPAHTVRQYPAGYLKNYEDPAIFPALLAAFEKEDVWNVQNGLMRAIELKAVSLGEKTEYKKIKAQVFRRLKDKTVSSRLIVDKARAAICLVKNFNEKPDGVESVLISVLDSAGNEYEKNVSIKILRGSKTARSTAAIKRALTDKNEIVRDTAKKALGEVDK